jgi:hypothetical protein
LPSGRCHRAVAIGPLPSGCCRLAVVIWPP